MTGHRQELRSVRRAIAMEPRRISERLGPRLAQRTIYTKHYQYA
jgi:hypothetical protein